MQEAPSTMAAESWSDLPQDLLLTVSELLDTDLDILRLRSVCSFWRSSVPPRPRPSPFPLQVPPLLNSDVRSSCVGGRFFLNYSTLYRLSLPEHGPRAGDPSDDWLFRVSESEVNPNRFSLLCPLVPDKVESHSGPIPKHLNLLDYRISEICKCYNLKFVNSMGLTTDVLDPFVWKVIVLRNYTVVGDFVVLVLFSDLTVSYWKFGQESWSLVDTMGHAIGDIAVCKGKCYAMTVEGDLVSFDSDMNLTLESPYLPMIHPQTVYSLVEYNSDLYGVKRIYQDPSSDDEDDSPFWCEIFKKCETWEHISCLGDAVFLSSENVSVGFSAEGFRCCKGNSVYVATRDFFLDNDDNNRKVIEYGVYDMAKGETAFMNAIEDCTFMYWPPPRLLSDELVLDNNNLGCHRPPTKPDQKSKLNDHVS